MSAALHLAKPTDLEKLMTLVAAFHDEMDLGTEETALECALIPLLDGSPYGAVYLLGPARAPMGYVVLTFGWSVELGGMDGFVDEIYLRPAVRGRGIAIEALLSLRKVMASAGVKALHLEVDREDERAQKLYKKARFELRDRYSLMTLKL